MIKQFKNSISCLAVAGAFVCARAENNVNIIKESDEPKTVVKDTVQVAKDPVTDSAKAANQAVYTPDTVGNIKPYETTTLQRRHLAKSFTGAGLGPAGFGNVDERQPAYDAYLGRFWEVNPHAAIKAVGDVATDLNHEHMADFSIGANFYALPTDFSPYLGGGLGVAYDRSSGENAYGFSLGASLGALMFRTASAQMNLEGNAKMVMDQLSNSNDMPTVYSARLGVMF